MKLKGPSTMKHFCLGFGCSYFPGFQPWNSTVYCVSTLLTISVPGNPFLPVKETFKIIIKCPHGLKVLKKCSAEKELMTFPQLRRFGKALDCYQWLTTDAQLLRLYSHCSLYYSRPSYILKTSIPGGWGLCPMLFGLCLQSLVHRLLNVECNLFFKSY